MQLRAYISKATVKGHAGARRAALALGAAGALLAHGLGCSGSDDDGALQTTPASGGAAASAGAATTGCGADEFACGSGECIPLSQYCDGQEWNCADRSDEANCACGPDEFTCGSGECIPLSQYCDGQEWNCADQSDETNCGTSGTGGTAPTGGTTNTGGTAPTGGTTNTGGTTPTGGTTNTGGTTSTGGTVVNPPREFCGEQDRVPVVNDDIQYVVQNNIWGGSDDSQCISVQGSSFEVSHNTNNSNNNSPTGYPSIFRGCHWGACTTNNPMPVQVGSINSVPSTWSVSTASGSWNISYDLWFDTRREPNDQPNGCELMIWINHQGGVNPAGNQAGTANIAGANWEVWTTNIGWNYIAYRRSGGTTSVNFDLNDFIQDAVGRGSIESGWYLIDVEAGFELWNGGVGLTSNSFTVDVN